MFGGGTSTSDPKINQVQVQTSALGVTLPVCWGSVRASVNLIWYGDFVATPHEEDTGGKGGGSTHTSYTYAASIILGLVLGTVGNIRTIWRDKDVITPDQAGLSVADGATGQPVWGHLTTYHPDEAIGYSGLAYLYAAHYALSDQASLSNHSAEVQRARAIIGLVTMDDARPNEILTEVLTSPEFGLPQWPSGTIEDLSNYRDYCLAAGLLLSPLLDAQQQAGDFLKELATATNSEIVFRDGRLGMVPLGDEEITGNGVTWIPNIDPVFEIGDDDLVPPSQDEQPLTRTLKRTSDAFNDLSVEYLNRDHSYNTDLAPAQDQANVDQYGRVKATSPISLHCIKKTGVAAVVAQLLVQRSCNVRTEYKFMLDWRYSMLEEMDVLSITHRSLRDKLVRVLGIEETPENSFTITAEELLVGVGTVSPLLRQGASGYTPNWAADPGVVQPPVIFDGPAGLTSRYEVWIAAAGLDPNWGGCQVWISTTGDEYRMIGSIEGRARYGVTTSLLPSIPDPDTTSTLGVDLSTSLGSLDATVAAADDGQTDALVGDEVLDFGSAALTAPSEYDLSYLRRGRRETAVATHTSGSDFVRLDDAIFKYPVDPLVVGQLLYIKLVSFNLFGRTATMGKGGTGSGETLDTAVAWEFTPQALPAPTILEAIPFLEPSGGSTGVRVAVKAGGPDAPGLRWFLRWRADGAAAWSQAQYDTITTYPDVQIDSPFIPGPVSVSVGVAYETPNGRISDWSATVVVDTSSPVERAFDGSFSSAFARIAP